MGQYNSKLRWFAAAAAAGLCQVPVLFKCWAESTGLHPAKDSAAAAAAELIHQIKPKQQQQQQQGSGFLWLTLSTVWELSGKPSRSFTALQASAQVRGWLIE
jgi:hypothetical protein